MLIRPENSLDTKEISQLILDAFRNHPYASGTEPTESLIVESLREQEALTLSIIAKVDGVLVGHAAFSPVLVNGQHTKLLGLGPVAVHPQRQSQGIGSKLILRGLELIRERGFIGCVVLGEPSYYSRFGFNQNPDLILEGMPPEYFLSLSFGESLPKGRVTYHQAFSLKP